MRVLFAAGGTGGHVYPAIAIADALKGRAEIIFAGTADRLERRIVPQAGYPLRTIASRPLARGRFTALLQTLPSNVLGFFQSLRLLRAFRPDLVIATGGYVCFPLVFAASTLRRVHLLRCGLALLEPNIQPGLTNRMLAPIVDEIWDAMPAQTPDASGKHVVTGVPVRASLLSHADRGAAAQRLDLRPDRFTILVLGGSQGARSINRAVMELASGAPLPEDWQILHVSGERDFKTIRAAQLGSGDERRIVTVPYLADMRDAYSVADVVVARSGASTLGELAALGIPSILVPYPFATDDHQLRNARAFEAAGAAVVIEDGSITGESLLRALHDLAQPERLAEMRIAARSLSAGDSTAAILARIDALVSRKTVRA